MTTIGKGLPRVIHMNNVNWKRVKTTCKNTKKEQQIFRGNLSQQKIKYGLHITHLIRLQGFRNYLEKVRLLGDLKKRRPIYMEKVGNE